MRDEAISGTSLLSTVYGLEGAATKTSAQVWRAAGAANSDGGVWTAVFQLWFGFVVCVALIMAIIYVSRCILGPDKFASQEERDRVELLAALNRSESFSMGMGSGGLERPSVGGAGGLWSAASSVIDAQAEPPLRTPERTSPRSIATGVAAKADAVKDTKDMKDTKDIQEHIQPSTAVNAPPAPAPVAMVAGTKLTSNVMPAEPAAPSAPLPAAQVPTAATAASKPAAAAESENSSSASADETASNITMISKAASSEVAPPALQTEAKRTQKSQSQQEPQSQARKQQENEQQPQQQQQQLSQPATAVAPQASTEAVDAQGSKRGGAGVSFGNSEEHHHHVHSDDDHHDDDGVGDLPPIKSNVRWMNKSLARTKSTISVRDDPDEDLDELRPPWSHEALVEVLDKTDVPVIAWPQESFDTFVEELKGGLSRMRTREGHPMRDVDLLLLIVENGDQVLQEQPSKDDENRFPAMPEKVIATRMKVDEDMVDARKRLLKKAGIPEAAVMMHDNLLDVTDTVENMDLFPGLGSRVRKFLAHCEVATSDPKLLRTLGAPNGTMRVKGSGSSIKTYKWVSKESCIGLLKYFKRATAAKKRATYLAGRGHASMYWTVDGEAEVMLPWSAKALEELCQKHSIKSIQKDFGFPLNHIVSELNEGYSFLTLAKGSVPSKLIICRDIVSLLLDNAGEAAVIPTAGHEDADDDEVEAALPCQLRLADESCAATARHVAKKSLGMSASELLLSETELEQVDVTDLQRQKYDVQIWSDEDRPPNRRIRHFIVHGQHSNEVVAKATTMRIAKERTATAAKAAELPGSVHGR
mmetsp:Transcript_80784/g.168533  ORF Transcript_80784/g.168533 Transcript_80784/m.168533 type:complete len:815 (-) Transcript_80784:50-2494(-)